MLAGRFDGCVLTYDVATLKWKPMTQPLVEAGEVTIGGTMVVGQGAAGTQLWKVDASGATVPVSISGSVPVTGTFWPATQPVSGTVSVDNFPTTQPVSIATMPSTPVTGTFWQATQPVSLATMPSTPVTGTFWQETQPVSAAVLPLPAGAATEATLAALPIAQATDAAGIKGPMVQGVVNDTPNTYLTNEIRPLSLTSEGRLRVSSLPAYIDNVWQHTFDDPWAGMPSATQCDYAHIGALHYV